MEIGGLFRILYVFHFHIFLSSSPLVLLYPLEEIAPYVMPADFLRMFSDQKPCTVLHYIVNEMERRTGGS